jgi:alkylation response protein AidB-like acyl-CoA dehydrogenase
MTEGHAIQEVRGLARDFAATKLRPNTEEWDAAGALDDSVLPELAELGFFGMLVPEADGGMGLDAATYVAALEEIAWGEPAAALLVAQSVVAADLVLHYGDDAQRARWLAPLASGELLGCLALADENRADTDEDSAARAERAGDGWRLAGCKKWVANGERAGLAVLLATTGDGLHALFTVPREAGFRAGPRVTTLGLRAAPLVELDFSGLVLDDGHRLAGFAGDAQVADSIGRLSAAAMAVGISQAALEHATGYAAEREQFGVPIRSFEGIQHKLAEMATRTLGARLLLERAASRPDDAAATAMAKLAAAECAMYVTTEAVQVFGGYGYMRDYPVEKLMRDAKATQIIHGPSEVQRLLIAQALYA